MIYYICTVGKVTIRCPKSQVSQPIPLDLFEAGEHWPQDTAAHWPLFEEVAVVVVVAAAEATILDL